MSLTTFTTEQFVVYSSALFSSSQVETSTTVPSAASAVTGKKGTADTSIITASRKLSHFLFFIVLHLAFLMSSLHRVNLIHQIFGCHRAIEKLIDEAVFLRVPDILRRLFFGVGIDDESNLAIGTYRLYLVPEL